MIAVTAFSECLADPFLDEVFALPVRALCVLLVDSRNTAYAARLVVACKCCGEDTQQSLGIKTIGLGSPGSPSDQNARRLDDMMFDAVRQQEPV